MLNKDYSRKFPIGVQSFEALRDSNFMYVDKTYYVYDLAQSGKAYFLSRPRRFGKSLFLSTLKAYFEGKKELFEGLAIESLEKEWKKHPVLHFDFNAEVFDSIESLNALINDSLAKYEHQYGSEKTETTVALRFKGIINRAHLATGAKAVVLIDEYHKPLLQTIDNEELHDEYRKSLKAFYGALKSQDADLEFYFLTGVTKFSQVSVFSDLNQLKDISYYPAYNEICGLTWNEIEQNFKPEIEKLAKNNDSNYIDTRNTLIKNYDGYYFSDPTKAKSGVFNPFSVLNVLMDSEYDDYWFQTGTPTFLVNLMKKSDLDLRKLEGYKINTSEIRKIQDSRTNTSSPIPVLYQSGYLTIKKYDSKFKSYTLGFPNEEVKRGFIMFCAQFFTRIPEKETGFNIEHFVREIEQGKVDEFMERMRSFFANIPYELNDQTERHYQVVFYIVFTLIGFYTEAEYRSARGRADMVVKTQDHIYVFEFKLDGTAESALAQIDDKGYLIPFTCDNRPVTKIGANFSKEQRNIERWIIV
ncbi:MAG: ATP-binding protein [Fibrobacter sp.]|nr:ATP-binding protein [Fibrobacter sp.]